MSFEIHREPMYRRYHATYCSGACCYALFFGVTLVLLPLFLAYNTTGFWYKDGTYYEQPRVTYRYQTITEMHGRRWDTVGSGGSVPFSLYFSTTPALNRLHSDTLRSPVVKSAEFDDNHDGTNDRLEINLQMPLQANEDITSVSTMVLFDFALNERAKVKFDAAAVFSFDGASGIEEVSFGADVVMRQTWPLQVRGAQKSPYAASPLLPVVLPEGTSASEYSIRSISEAMASRNFSAVTRNAFTTAVHSRSAAVTASQGSDMKSLTATINLRMPEQTVWFTPGVSEIFKWAWIQYLSMFAVVWFLLSRLSDFIFRHQLIYAKCSTDIVYEKLD
jgi:transmembrane protein 231